MSTYDVRKADNTNKNLLLLSGSKATGNLAADVQPGYLDFAEEWIKDLFAEAIQNKKPILFVPYARPGGISEEAYFNFVKERMDKMGIQLVSAPSEGVSREILESVGGIFIGGGHTYTLLGKLQKTNSLENIRHKVNAGLPYLGSSAGTLITCPTVKTGNDMPCPAGDIIDLRSLGLIEIQLNCHYMDDAMHDPKHQGETRDTRLKEFCIFNPGVPVLGLYEGTGLRVVDDGLFLLASQNARGIKAPVFYKKDGSTQVERREIVCEIEVPEDIAEILIESKG